MSESQPVDFNIFTPPCSFLAIEHILLTTLLLFIFYILPSIIAYGRSSKNLIPIICCNMLLGWTFIVWVVALIWALNTGSYNHEQENEYENKENKPKKNSSRRLRD